MSAYYNENDRHAAAWLRELIRRNLIAPGDVDERSIVDVQPADLAGYDQCHFFAGIGVWSYALRCAGWADDRPVWTGSCPCQPFSAAGKGDEYGDDRHLWPAWFRLIRERRPVVVFGEQVASKVALAWLDHVCADMEAEGYAVGAVDTCAAGFGAPHIRQRLYFVADSSSEQRGSRRSGCDRESGGWTHEQLAGSSAAIPVAESMHTERRRPLNVDGEDGRDGADAGRTETRGDTRARGQVCAVADAHEAGSGVEWRGLPENADAQSRRDVDRCSEHDELGDAERAGRKVQMVKSRNGAEARGFRSANDDRGASATNGFWRDAEWIACRDGKARPVEPGSPPLVTGTPARMGFVCAACLEAATQDADDEGLRVLRKIAGEDDRGLAQEVLQSIVHGEGLHQDADDKSGWTLPGAATLQGDGVSALRQDGPIPTSSPSGREPDEQCPGEYLNSMRRMPREGTCADACILCGAEAEWLAECKLRGNRVVKLRGYGNSIVAPVAEEFIRAYLAA